ncbi:MAG TPA: acyltransferase [Polyangiales bacterium]|nr:acyltransferase [Polyangiales bacterium]
MNKKIDALDGLRGWMAFWVWVTHVSTLATLPFEKKQGFGWVLANGEFAVGVFVILSGFVISMTLSESADQDKRVFYVRRGFRLFPAYLICLAISAFVTLDVSIAALRALPWDAPRTLDRLQYLQDSRAAFWTHFALHVPLLHGLVPDRILPSTSYAFMGQAWSLTLEWQFYLLAPFAVAFMRWFEWTPVRQGALLSVLALLARRSPQSSMLPSSLYLFAIGYFAYLLYQRRNQQPLSAARFSGYVAVWLLTAAVVSIRCLAILIWAPVLYSVIAKEPPFMLVKLRELFCSRISTRLGAISYSFYCCHTFVIFGCAYILVVVMGVHDRTVYAASLIVSSLLVSLALSALLYAFVEKPCIAVGRRAARALQAKAKAHEAAVEA